MIPDPVEVLEEGRLVRVTWVQPCVLGVVGETLQDGEEKPLVRQPTIW